MKEEYIQYWNTLSQDYESAIYPITKWIKKRNRITNQLTNNSKILIIGAGSETYLVQDIINRFPLSSITLLDISTGMLEKSKEKFTNDRIIYLNQDVLKLNLTNSFDCIITTNSLLLPTPADNEKAFKRLIIALKPQGKIIAYLPSFESCLNLEQRFHINLNLNKIMQSVDDGIGFQQSFWTKSQLKQFYKYGTIQHKKIYCSESYPELKTLINLYHLKKKSAKEVFEHFIIFTKKGVF